jgi:hypothetical protein
VRADVEDGVLTDARAAAEYPQAGDVLSAPRDRG